MGTMVGTKFRAKPAERKEGLESRSMLAPSKCCASAQISSSDCGPRRGKGSILRTSSGMSENRSSIDLRPMESSISCSLPKFGNWSIRAHL